MAFSIRAGVIIDQFKNIRRSRISAMPTPETVVISLDGACPLVSVGETVLCGQRIAESDKSVIHASIPGRVASLDENYIKIEWDKSDNASETSPFDKKLADVTSDEIISILREAGISHTDELYRTFTEAFGKIDKIIINCCEEPPLTSLERIVVEHPASVVNGVKILLKLFGVKSAYIAIENTKTEAITRLGGVIKGSRMISVKTVLPKYPLSDEKQIAYLLGDADISLDKPTFESGVAVFDPELCAAIYNAFSKGMPYTHRTISVGGDCIKKHQNISVPIGTSLGDIVEFCGGLIREPKYFISGGSLSGKSMESPEFYVSKEIRGILLLSERAVTNLDADADCMRCGRCAEHCPMHLMPMYIAEYSRCGKYERAIKCDADLCIECGTCSYVCPAERDIVSLIRRAKSETSSVETEIQPECEVNDGQQ